MRHIFAVLKFRMLEVRANETALRKLSDGTAQLHTIDGTLVVAVIAGLDVFWPIFLVYLRQFHACFKSVRRSSIGIRGFPNARRQHHVELARGIP